MNASYSLFSQPVAKPPQPLNIENIRKALVLIPHPDDESIGCGGLLALLAERGTPVHVVLVSDGSGAGGLPEGAGLVRQHELSQALNVLGASITYECLGLPDGSLSQVEGLQAKIQASIDRFQPSVLVAPWMQDMHPDHAATGYAALRAHQDRPLSQGVLFYEVWTPLTANLILNISQVWPKKQKALEQHKTALSCGDYLRATEALAAYRSLLSGNLAAQGEYAEAFYGLDWCEVCPYDSSLRQRYHVRYATAQDADALRQLFIDVFQHTPSSDWWPSKYGQETVPGTVAVNENQAIIAYYGALSRRAFWQNKTLNVAQQADVMVSSHYRFSTKRHGVFASVSRLFLQEQLGQARTYQMAFGFPTVRALHLGIRLELYQQGDELAYWQYSNQYNRLGIGWQVSVQKCAAQKNWHWVDGLKPFMAQPEGYFWLEKSGAYWQQRFAQNTEKKYSIVRLFRWGRLAGVAIVQTTAETIEIMDLALTDRHPHSAQKLIAAIINYGCKVGLSKTAAWGTRIATDELQRHAESLQCKGESIVEHAGYMALPAAGLDVPLVSQIKGHCWMLGADTDFR
ncbi:N-acetylglucosaminyl deacetylase, LmbE family [Oceanospirillum multiglobuliferum]|uniref:N-acetylglucosaminylphosphatidylinositol deacetylase n=1 Tax=Oceanospirillum multiglobuliferum TaxID=64969 RepID=A0A1T4Q7C8_9GAMM|nr:GNAT family N-acetyltransferase [Oceanospirillum multiglobuliferum]OPX56589.1 hypothetical protein BTE48_03985 [Oceanospirillum multiglobuliferum]SJZ99672.1 N-acetylglucosaminyl deacetylase, LmbE family [Oceanospirillum multiglobuliferum]